MKRSVLTVSLALLMFAGVGAADDFLGDGGVPNRGDPLSVYASWEFLNDPDSVDALSSALQQQG